MKHLLLTLFILIASWSGFALETAPALPTKPAEWLDGMPLQWENLKGKVVLLNVWTFGCWNSYRSLPWVVSLNKKFPDLKIIGIHSPEFNHEKDRTKLRATMTKYNVSYPQLLDDDYRYWRQLGNRYWPSFYIVDQQGRIRGKFAGETHSGDSQAEEIEELIRRLSSE